MQVADSILDQIKSNITGIENRDDLPDDEKVSQFETKKLRSLHAETTGQRYYPVSINAREVLAGASNSAATVGSLKLSKTGLARAKAPGSPTR